MSKPLYVVQTNPVPGREAEFNDWYTNQHLSDILRVPGFVSAQRFRRSEVQKAGDAGEYPYGYLAFYEIAGDTRSALDALATAVDNGLFLSPAMEAARSSIVFDPITDRISR